MAEQLLVRSLDTATASTRPCWPRGYRGELLTLAPRHAAAGLAGFGRVAGRRGRPDYHSPDITCPSFTPADTAAARNTILSRLGRAGRQPRAGGQIRNPVILSRRPGGALADVSLTIRPGAKVALVGPNGSRQNTLMLHLTAFWAGRPVRIGGLPLTRDTCRFIRARVGWCSRTPTTIFSPTVFEDVALRAAAPGAAGR